jgi:adenylylsulfate kinase-like enzyme
VHSAPKGLYRRPIAGEIRAFTGISDSYEIPTEPDVSVDTLGVAPEEAAAVVLVHLDSRARTLDGR